MRGIVIAKTTIGKGSLTISKVTEPCQHGTINQLGVTSENILPRWKAPSVSSYSHAV